MSTLTADHGSSALTSLRRHWIPAILLTFLTTLIGGGTALVRPTTYTGETRLAIGHGEMSALNIPGYPTAAKEMASNYSRWVTDQGVAGLKTPPEVSSLSASPIPESSIIRIEAKGRDADAAVRASQQAADALTAEVNKSRAENDPAEVMKEIVAKAPALSKAQAGAAGSLAKYNRDLGAERPAAVIQADLEVFAQVDTVRAQLQAEQDARLDKYRRLVSQRSTSADLRPIGQGARLVGNDRSSRLQRGALLGAGVGMVLALGVAVLLDRRSHRQQTRA
ncbi:hypothetical protein [Austwickia chelonae]|uniref:hypothetical protein n=1 Tax=Austwickia chelonae TaxID=100225 RepID=UPI000E24AB0E|nr:hypothetical protein [Austwickia chelonae]